ncbi:MAG: response regulator [Planctomycetota bacterium]|jgi:DNA-binding response OmpR family regulator
MLKILIVEDDAGFRGVLETMLRLDGHEVFLAANGENGLSQARNHKPDIILSDISMPQLTGTELCKAVRSDEDLKHTYVMLITGQGDQEVKLESLRAGADDFIVKPSSGPEIKGRLEIAQRIMAMHQREMQALERAKTAEASLAAAEEKLGAAEAAVGSAADAMAQRDAGGLKSSLERTRDAIQAVRKACGDGAVAEDSDGSWL